MVRECLKKSPIVGVGQSFVTKFGDIRLIELYDHDSGMIGIKPNGWSEVWVHTVDWRVEDVGPMTVQTNFFTLAGGGCIFYVCGPDVPVVTPTPIPPTPTPLPTTCRQEFKVYDGLVGDAPGATVTINGVVYTTNSTGYTSVLLTVGKEYTATGKFGDRSKTYTFTACKDIIKFRLTTIIIPDGFIYCKAYDSMTNEVLNATIVVDGVTQPNKTPGKTWNLPPGTHTVAFNLTGYLTKTISVTVKAAETVDATVQMSKAYTPTPTPIPTLKGKIHCITNPTGATIQIMDLSLVVPFYINYGLTDKYSIELNAGSYNVKFTRSGYQDYVTKVVVVAGELKYVTKSLIKVVVPTPTPTPAPGTGYIKCQAYESVTNASLSATLRIDGTTIAPRTPHTTPALPVGQHTVTFILEGYETKTVTVTVREGVTVNAYGSMVKLALPDIPGFDIKVNIPGLLPKSSLHIEQVIKVPFTDTWWSSPLGSGMRWDNISNGVFKARARSADSSPTPDFYAGFAEGKDYAVYVGTSAVAFYPGSIIHRSTSKVTGIDLTSSYIDWVSSKVCATFGISPANCPFFVATSVNDAAFLLELWSIITKHENLAGEHVLPTALDYALIPVAIFGLFSPGISEGAIASMIGKRFGKLIELSKKGVIDAKELAQDPRLSTFMLRATDSQFSDLVLHLEEGNLKTARILLGVVENISPTNLELNALDRAVKLTKKTDESLVASNSVEKLPTVLSKFSDKFAEIYASAVRWATAHPAETAMIGIGVPAVAAIVYIIDQSSINFEALVDTKGIKAGDTSWTAKNYIDVIDTYMFNVKDAEKARDWDAFCENIALWKAEVDKLKAFILVNGTTLRSEGTYDVLESSIHAYYKAIEIKEKVHTCVHVALPETIIAEVVEILDSDTVRIRYDGSVYTVRLLGINSPESGTYTYRCTDVKQPYLVRRLLRPEDHCINEELWHADNEFYIKTKEWIGKNLPRGSTAIFKTDLSRQFDDDGRILAVPFYNGKNVCMESLKAGQSVVFFYDVNKHVNTGAFLAAEKVAKDANIGVWPFAVGTGIIRCVSHPTAAEVWLDGVYTGKKTISSIAYLDNIPVGDHTVSFKKIINDVMNSCSKSVTVTQDATVSAECTLSPGEIPTVPTTCEDISQLFNNLIKYYDKDNDKRINNAEVSSASYDHHIGEISDTEKDVVETFWAKDCVLTDEVPTPTPTPLPGVTPTPTPAPPKATWQIGDVKNEAGATLGAAKVYVDDIYVKHYAPELLTFCTGCSCDTVIPCGFGTHTVSIKKTGYQDWNKTRTLGSGDSFADSPVMKLIPSGTFPVTFLSQPSGATIKIDGKDI